MAKKKQMKKKKIRRKLTNPSGKHEDYWVCWVCGEKILPGDKFVRKGYENRHDGKCPGKRQTLEDFIS